MLPIAAHFARAATEERARSALPGAPVRQPREVSANPTRSSWSAVRHRLATGLRRAADRLEPATQ